MGGGREGGGAQPAVRCLALRACVPNRAHSKELKARCWEGQGGGEDTHLTHLLASLRTIGTAGHSIIG